MSLHSVLSRCTHALFTSCFSIPLPAQICLLTSYQIKIVSPLVTVSTCLTTCLSPQYISCGPTVSSSPQCCRSYSAFQSTTHSVAASTWLTLLQKHDLQQHRCIQLTITLLHQQWPLYCCFTAWLQNRCLISTFYTAASAWPILCTIFTLLVYFSWLQHYILSMHSIVWQNSSCSWSTSPLFSSWLPLHLSSGLHWCVSHSWAHNLLKWRYLSQEEKTMSLFTWYHLVSEVITFIIYSRLLHKIIYLFTCEVSL